MLRPIQSNELNGAEKELLDLLRRKFFDKDKKSGARKVRVLFHPCMLGNKILRHLYVLINDKSWGVYNNECGRYNYSSEIGNNYVTSVALWHSAIETSLSRRSDAANRWTRESKGSTSIAENGCLFRLTL